jgi:hypothetical protein
MSRMVSRSRTDPRRGVAPNWNDTPYTYWTRARSTGLLRRWPRRREEPQVQADAAGRSTNTFSYGPGLVIAM